MARRQRKRAPPAIIPGPSDQSAASPKVTPPEPTSSVSADAGVPTPWDRKTHGAETGPQQLAKLGTLLYHTPSATSTLPIATSTLTEPAAGQWQDRSPPTVPPSVGDTAGASSPEPSATFVGEGVFSADAKVVRLSSPASSSARTRTNPSTSVPSKRDVIRNPTEVIRYSHILISAFEEVLDYDPVRQHNQRPPALWSGDPSYQKDVHDLVTELRRLNSLLEARRSRKTEARKAAISLARHLDSFWRSYSKTLGKGAAYLTLAVIVGLLSQAGVGLGEGMVMKMWSALKPPH
jgi:hypothetical protein